MPWANDREAREQSNRTYGAEYRRNRERAMSRDRWRCQIQLPGICIHSATECDHIVSVADGGTHAVTNLRAACRPCHRARTAQQGGGRRNRRTANPAPRPREQWFSSDPPAQPRTSW